jgi:dihydroorotate dehydrogenase/Pyruvate/2-oxoacid:ferredoxin oxidoreductase delta subunit
MSNVDLSVKIAGVRFKNPVAAASGVITRSVQSVEGCIKSGASAIVTKSISFVSGVSGGKWRLPRPAIWLLDKYGDPGSSQNISIGNFREEEGIAFVKKIKPLTQTADVVLIPNINIMGDTDFFSEEEALERTASLAKKLESSGADMLEIFKACPIDVGRNSGGDWATISDIDHLVKVAETLKNAVDIPFYFKLHTDVTCAHFDKLEKVGVAGHTIYSLFPATVIDIETGMPILPFPSPYYGRGISAHENYQTARLASLTSCPIITSGGTMTGRDVISRLMCGASVVQVMTAAMRYGPIIFTDMVNGLENFMIRKGYESLQDIKGISVPHVNNPEEYERFVSERQVPKEVMAMTIDRVKCVGCAQCSVCPYGAMSMHDGFPKWEPKVCEFCGLCQTICLADAITIRRRK